MRGRSVLLDVIAGVWAVVTLVLLVLTDSVDVDCVHIDSADGIHGSASMHYPPIWFTAVGTLMTLAVAIAMARCWFRHDNMVFVEPQCGLCIIVAALFVPIVCVIPAVFMHGDGTIAGPYVNAVAAPDCVPLEWGVVAPLSLPHPSACRVMNATDMLCCAHINTQSCHLSFRHPPVIDITYYVAALITATCAVTFCLRRRRSDGDDAYVAINDTKRPPPSNPSHY